MRYVILGGTGTLGRTLIRELLKQDDVTVVCFSRDELKQKETEAQFRDSRLSFKIGDIRDAGAVAMAMAGADVVFHVAALKHVDSMQANPEESVKTNILGTMNVAHAAVALGVPHVVFSSTDKAVSPVNVYGHCKAISEQILLNLNETQSKTRFSVYRWGNVVGSRGSAIHSFAKTLKEERKVYLTDWNMTRFWIRIEDAVRFMLETYQQSSGIMVPIMKSAPVVDMVQAIAEIVGVPSYDVVITGMRPGEKVHESILQGLSSCDGPYYPLTDLKKLVREAL